MDSYIINGVCRCCASQGSSKDIDSAYTWMGDEEIYSKMLRDCFDIALERSEAGHDGGICELCVTQLRNAFNFKKQVVNTEEMLKKRIHSDPFKTDVKLEVSREDPSDSDNDAADHDMGDDSSVKDFLVPIKMEVEVDAVTPTKAKRAAKAGTSSAKKPKLEAETSKSTSGIQGGPTSSSNLPETTNKRTLGKSPPKSCTKLTQLAPKSICKIIFKREDTSRSMFRNPRTLEEPLQLAPKAPTITRIEFQDCSSNSTHNSVEIVNPKEKPLPPDRAMAARFRENILNLLHNSNASLIRKIDHGGFHCRLCEERWPEAAQLKSHFIEIHTQQEALETIDFKSLGCSAKLDITALTCSMCGEEGDTIELFLEHLRTKHKLRTHDGTTLLPFKFDKPGYSCVVCIANFGTFKSLLSHMHVHYNSHECEVCGAGFYNRTSMRSHRLTHVTAKDAFKCTTCEKTFDNDRNRINHEKRVHLHHKAYMCHVCKEKFQDYYERNTHCKEVHGLKDMGNFQCQACDRKFKRSYGLRTHVQKHHLMERRFYCEICDSKFWSAQVLKDHMIKHTGAITEFVCPECEKVFSRKRVLRKHMESHLPVGQYECEYCYKAFTQQGSLNYHLKAKHAQDILSPRSDEDISVAIT